MFVSRYELWLERFRMVKDLEGGRISKSIKSEKIVSGRKNKLYNRMASIKLFWCFWRWWWWGLIEIGAVNSKRFLLGEEPQKKPQPGSEKSIELKSSKSVGNGQWNSNWKYGGGRAVSFAENRPNFPSRGENSSAPSRDMCGGGSGSLFGGRTRKKIFYWKIPLVEQSLSVGESGRDCEAFRSRGSSVHVSQRLFRIYWSCFG